LKEEIHVMSYEHPLAILHPYELGTDKGGVLITSTLRFLSQGDSWFSIGQFPAWATSNVLFNLRLPASAATVSFASPGKTFVQSIDWSREVKFATYLAGGRLAYPWDAILLSVGGNDLFDAILTLPGETNPQKASLRLLQTPADVASGTAISRYIRPAGWDAFLSVIVDCFSDLIAKRDDPDSLSNGVPIFVHTYDCPQPRDASAAPGLGPWLSRAFTAYQIPGSDWLPLTTYIIGEWAKFLDTLNERLSAVKSITKPNIRPINLVGTLNPAKAGSTGPFGDWENEIHPSLQGYAKLGIVFEKQLALT
jgi:hypothetical protein